MLLAIHQPPHLLTTSRTLGFQLGRPMRIDTGDVTVGKPKSYMECFADIQKEVLGGDSTITQTHAQLKDNVLNHRVHLCEIMAPCGYFL